MKPDSSEKPQPLCLGGGGTGQSGTAALWWAHGPLLRPPGTLPCPLCMATGQSAPTGELSHLSEQQGRTQRGESPTYKKSFNPFLKPAFLNPRRLLEEAGQWSSEGEQEKTQKKGSPASGKRVRVQAFSADSNSGSLSQLQT